MTDEQIIKALKYCNGYDCETCKALRYCDYMHPGALARASLDLINRQKARIKELRSDKIIAETHEKAAKDLFVDCAKQREEAKAEIKRLKERISYLEESIDCSRKEYNRLLQKLQQAKSEAIKEFAERLKSRLANLSVQTKTHGGKTTPNYVDDIANQILHKYVPEEIDNLVKEMMEEESK